MNPIDLLPVPKPYSDPNPPTETFFYENVVKQILPDVMKMESTGIPIDLSKVEEIERITDKILGEVQEKLSENPIIQDFLASKYNNYVKEKSVCTKTKESFEKPYNANNKQQRTYVINQYLIDHDLEKDQLDTWSFKDLRKYADIKGLKFLEDLANKNYSPDTVYKIKGYMERLAEEKYRIYSNNIKEKAIEKGKEISFNPNSTKQKVELFQFLGIEPESKTKKGNDQWNRDQLEILQKKLELELEEVNG